MVTTPRIGNDVFPGEGLGKGIGRGLSAAMEATPHVVRKRSFVLWDDSAS